MKVVDVDPLTDPRWKQLILNHESDIFHSPDWIRVLVETYGFQIRAYILLDNSDIPLAGLPICKIIDDQGERIVSLPFSDYCDPIVQHKDHWAILSNHLLQTGHTISMRCLHNAIPLSDQQFSSKKKAKWHGMDLQDDLDSIWKSMNKVERYTIRKARDKGTVLRIAECENDLRAFFELHLWLRKHKYHMLAQPYRFFEHIWRNLVEQEKGVLILAFHSNRVIGGTMFLEWKDRLYYKFNTSSPEYLHFSPNDLLLWEGIQFAKSRKLRRLDFGLSDWDQDGLISFKRKYAREEKTITFLQHTPTNSTNGNGAHFRSLLPQLTGLFTEELVPDSVTEKAGDLLYRFFT